MSLYKVTKNRYTIPKDESIIKLPYLAFQNF